MDIQRLYLKEHKLSPGTNLLRHHFGLMGLPDWISEEQEVVSLPSVNRYSLAKQP